MKKNNQKDRRKWAGFLPLVLLFTLFATACEVSESPVDVISDDTTKPGVISDVHVENLNGAAKITYTLPRSQNLLYVSARYSINGDKVRESKTSYYQDTILVDGFAREGEYDVTLHTVSRANVMSDPVIVKVHPKTPNYILVNEGLEILPDFGGANFYGTNPTGAPISLHLLTYNSATGQFDEHEPEYVRGESINISLRGFEPVEREFGVYIKDRFGNASETRYASIVPLYEEKLDKNRFFTYPLPSDAPDDYGWVLSHLFDDDPNTGWHTQVSPLMAGTFGLGQTAKISRFVLLNRLPDMYGWQNPKEITIWGSNEDAPEDHVLPRTSEPGTVAGDWVNMGNFSYPNPPSGLPPSQANAADIAFAAEGINFVMPSTAPSVKYIRFIVTQTWGGLNYVNAMELTFYGSPEQ